MDIPDLNLSYGQLAWALSAGAEPDDGLFHQLNYLRQLDIPLSLEDRRQHRSYRRQYSYDHLIECGVGLFALRHHIKPADVRLVLVTHRTAMRALYRRALAELPKDALDASWVRSRGAEVPILGEEIWLRLHDRFAKAPGHFDVLGPDDFAALEGLSFFDLVERVQGQRVRGLIPLTRLVLELTYWALKAPVIRPGPKS